MKIYTIRPKINNSFGAIKIKPSLRKNIKSQAQILIENANKTINDKTADDSFERTSKRFYDYSKEMDAKKDEISERFFPRRAMYQAMLEERDEKVEILKEKETDLRKLDDHLGKVTKTVDSLKTQLEQLDSNTQIKSMRESEEIQDLKAKYMTNEGFSQLAGYEDEKNILYKYFISEIEKAKQGQKANVPNAVLFFGPKGNGKTTFSEAFAQEIGAKRRNIMPKGVDDFIEKLLKGANKAKEIYEEKGKLTVIFIDEIDGLTNSKSTIIPELIEFLKDCYDKYHCIVFAATNHPLNLQLPITGDDSIFPYVVSVDPPNLENKQAVLKYYLSERLGNSVTDEDYKMLAEMLQQKEEETGNLYSNSVISEDICLSENEDVGISIADIIENIKKTEPDIDSTAVKKYNNEMDLIMADRVEE